MYWLVLSGSVLVNCCLQIASATPAIEYYCSVSTNPSAWTLKTGCLLICSCTTMRLIWSLFFVLRKHPWLTAITDLFLPMERSEGNESRPSSLRSLWLFLKAHLYSRSSAIKSLVEDEGAGGGEEQLEIHKCHQPHRGGCQSRHLDQQAFQSAFHSLMTKVHLGVEPWPTEALLLRLQESWTMFLPLYLQYYAGFTPNAFYGFRIRDLFFDVRQSPKMYS